MGYQRAVLCLLAVTACPAAAQIRIGTLPVQCVEVNTKVSASFNSGNLAGADATLSEFLAAGKAGNDALCAGLVLHNLAVIVYSSGRLTEAEALEDRALKILKAGREPRDPALLRPLITLWSARFQQRKFGRAREVFQGLRSIPLAKPEDRALVSGAAAEQALAEGRGEDAEREFQSALREWEQAGRGGTPYTTALLTGLGSLYVTQGRNREAEGVLQRAFEIISSSTERLPIDRVELFAVRGSLRAREKKWREAEEDFSSAIDIAARETALDAALVKPILMSEAFVLRKMHRNGEARLVENRARSIETPAAPDGVVDIAQLGDKFKRAKK
jgi:tetratricopeptide (TPR) repeat protein